mgnify:CR=1 FL=1
MKKRCVLFILCMMFLVGCSEQNEEIRNSVIEESTETESSLIIEEETEENKVSFRQRKTLQRRSPCHAGKNAGWDAGDGNFQTEGKYQSCKSSNGTSISE